VRKTPSVMERIELVQKDVNQQRRKAEQTKLRKFVKGET
jgi:hypothetical protein